MLKEQEQILPSLMNNKGFTLIGIAIIIIILGILLTLSVSMVGVSVKKTKCAKSRKIVNEAKKAIVGFTIKNMRLPTTTEFSKITKDTDAWKRNLIYIPDDAIIKYNGSTSRANITGTGTNICCGPTPIDLAVDDEMKGNFTDVAFVVLSTGENGNLDTTFNNKNIGSTTYYVATIEKPGENYDDIVEYMTLINLRAKTGSYPLYSVNNTISVSGPILPPFPPDNIYVKGGDYDTCTKIDNGLSFLIRDETVNVYEPQNYCIGSPHASISFDDAEGNDTNRNCHLVLNGNCSCLLLICNCSDFSLNDDD